MQDHAKFDSRFTMAGRLLATGILLLALFVLAACNSAGSLSEGLESAANPQPAQSVGNDTAPLPGATDPAQSGDPAAFQQPGQQSNQQPAGEQVASLPASNAVTFLPVSNAPQSAVTQLARSIRSEAGRAGVPVVGSVQQGAAYQVKGYFSALEDGSGTLLVYVWDVLDRNNKRVYRINGQEQASGRSSDPWAAVTPQMLDRVAQSTMAQLKSWLSSR